MHTWRQIGIDVIVSLLEPHEAVDLSLDQEQRLSGAEGIKLYSFPIPDRGVPKQSIHQLLRDIDSELSRGANAVVHCRQGIGRAGLLASLLLIERGFDADGAIRRVSAARSVPIPETAEQRAWIDTYAASLARKP